METLTLEAETGRLLDLVVHSLYTQREVFLRELITNASDALDRLRIEEMLTPELHEGDAALEILLEVDPVRRLLTIRDNGVGMTRDEVVRNIGTIARSGTEEFASTHRTQAAAAAGDQGFIGRFGVGFYSCFMVADRVSLTTRRAGDTCGTQWESTGDVQYTIREVADAPRGTSVTLQLKPHDADSGIDDYTDRWVLSAIVKRYADFVTHPIVHVEQRDASASDASAEAPARTVLNSMKPIWTRPSSAVAASEYDEFYRHLSRDFNEPLLRMSFKAEGRWEYSALVFVPSHAPHDLFFHGAAYGLQLYARRMLIVENASELVPRYLRFLKGVVDAADLPLNVSRQSLQDSHHLAAIRRWLTRKVLDTLQTLREKDPAKYETFWRAFGRPLKEGVSEDHGNQARLTSLLLFPSSAHETALTTFSDYVGRMKPDQTEIYYVTGESRAAAERSPHLEGLRARNYEVLFFTEPVDELLAHSLSEFDGRRLRSVAKGRVELGDDADRARAMRDSDAHAARLGGLLTFLSTHLASEVKAVRVSPYLTESPACLTGDEFDYSPHIERLLHGKSGASQRRTLELNPAHPIVAGLQRRFERDPSDPLIGAGAELLFGCALLASGEDLRDPAAFNTRVLSVLAGALDGEAAGAPHVE